MRYLPSAVAAFIIGIAFVSLDAWHGHDLEMEKRNLVVAAAQQAQLTWSDENWKLIFHARGLNAAFNSKRLAVQEKFEQIAVQNYNGNANILRVEVAPNFKTDLVYPYLGNQAHIGQNPLLLSPDDRDWFEADLQRGLAVVGSNRLVGERTSEIHIRVPMLTAEDDRISMTGVIYLVAQVDLIFPKSITTGQVHPLEFLLVEGLAEDSDTSVPAEWRQDSETAPVISQIARPGGSFSILARPTDGWRPTFGEMAGYRWRLAGLGLLMLLPVLLTNRIALSRNLTRHELAASERRMVGLLNNMPGAAFIRTMSQGTNTPSKDNELLFLNRPSCQEIWGVEADTVEKDIMTLWGLIDDPEIKDKMWKETVEASQQMRAWHFVWPIRTPGGVRKWLEGRGYPMRLENGSTRWYNLVVDASVQVERDFELERQRELAFQAQKHEGIGQLTGGVAHDFNNLLAVIMGNLELLRDDISNKEHVRLIDAGIDATKRGADLTRSMLAFARKARLEPVVIDLNEMVKDTRNWIGRTLPASISVETSLLAGLWSIEADPGSTESALLNLILNARDAMPDGGKLTIETANLRIDQSYTDSREEEIETGRYVMLAVSDTGHGIPDDVLQQIFEPFFSTKAPGSGSGLGLSMVQGFMRQSGGTVQVYTEPGEGTTFKLYFKARSGGRVEPREHLSVTGAANPSGQRILVAEDEPEVLTAIVATLERAGYAVTAASTGDQARVIFDDDPGFDLLLTDIVMPGSLQGTQLSRVLREKAPDLCVVFMSGYASEATVHGNGLRPEDIRLMKPVIREDLLSAIRQSLGT